MKRLFALLVLPLFICSCSNSDSISSSLSIGISTYDPGPCYWLPLDVASQDEVSAPILFGDICYNGQTYTFDYFDSTLTSRPPFLRCHGISSSLIDNNHILASNLIKGSFKNKVFEYYDETLVTLYPINGVDTDVMVAAKYEYDNSIFALLNKNFTFNNTKEVVEKISLLDWQCNFKCFSMGKAPHMGYEEVPYVIEYKIEDNTILKDFFLSENKIEKLPSDYLQYDYTFPGPFTSFPSISVSCENIGYSERTYFTFWVTQEDRLVTNLFIGDGYYSTKLNKGSYKKYIKYLNSLPVSNYWLYVLS